MIYLACFAISGLFAWLANRADKRRNFIIFSIISILIPVLLAGLRDYSIGVDVINYKIKDYYWLGLEKMSTAEFLKNCNWLGRREYGFMFLMMVLHFITSEFRIFLFVAHAIIMTAMYVGAFRLRKQVDPVMVLMLFYLFFFNHSLNIIRQYMAMAIIFAAFKDVLDRKYLRYCIVVAIAITIHSAAFLAFVAPLLHLFLYGNEPAGGFRLGKFTVGSLEKFPMWLRVLLVVGVLSAMMAFFAPICRFIINKGLLSNKYFYYLRVDSTSYSGIVTILLLIELAVLLCFRKSMRKRCNDSAFLVTGSAVYLILLQLTAFVYSSRRIALFFCLQNVVTLAYLMEAIPVKTEKQKKMVKAAFLCVGLMYWVYFYVLKNASQTFPYLSVFSG